MARMRALTTGMRKKGINKIEWIDKEEWRRKINNNNKKYMLKTIEEVGRTVGLLINTKLNIGLKNQINRERDAMNNNNLKLLF